MPSSIVFLTLSSVQYEVGSVGREIALEVQVAGELLTSSIRLALGQTRELSRELTQFWTDGDEFAAVGQIQVTERDAVYSETGSSPVSWTIDLSESGVSESVQRVEVIESGGPREGTAGVFLVTLRARVVAATRFVQEPETGWLTVIDEGGGRIALPETLCVEVFRVAEGREHFTITEGPHRGKRASVRLNSDGSSALSAVDPRGRAIKATYSVSRKALTVGTVTVQTVDYPLKPWTLGIYDIEIPDAPHRGGLRYPEATRSRTWFRVGHTGDRYIHTGAASAGCITVVDRTKWDQICATLIRGRKGDRVSVGTIEVKA
jgi:hypothetical protein